MAYKLVSLHWASPNGEMGTQGLKAWRGADSASRGVVLTATGNNGEGQGWYCDGQVSRGRGLS